MNTRANYTSGSFRNDSVRGNYDYGSFRNGSVRGNYNNGSFENSISEGNYDDGGSRYYDNGNRSGNYANESFDDNYYGSYASGRNAYETDNRSHISRSHTSQNHSNHSRSGSSRSGRRSSRKISEIVVNVLVGVAFAGVCLMFVLWIMGVEPKIVASGSMEPNIKVGSLCFVNTKYDYENIKVGDVIAYYAVDGSQVTHRVVEMNSAGFITKGDANQVQDAVLITPDNYMGKTGISIPLLGYVFAMLQTTAGKIVIMAIVVVILGIQIFRSVLEASYKKHKTMERRLPMSNVDDGREDSRITGEA